MIVKIKNDSEKPTQNWIYCEGDVVHPCKGESNQKDLVSIYSQDTLFLLNTSGVDSDVMLSYLHLTIYKNNQVVKRVVTNQRTYLMNEEGKTIDKLF